jgi:hypothetical protein
MYACVWRKDSERSCMCVWRQESERSCMRVSGDRIVSGHVCVCLETG